MNGVKWFVHIYALQRKERANLGKHASEITNQTQNALSENITVNAVACGRRRLVWIAFKKPEKIAWSHSQQSDAWLLKLSKSYRNAVLI